MYTEVTDAGDTLATAQSTVSASTPAGMSITTIAGSIGTGTDADLYLIYISSPATFSATTNNALTNKSFNGTLPLDTSLFLFDASGHQIAANDDTNGTSVTSTLAAGNAFYASLPAGYFYIGISISGNDPVNAAGQLLLAKSDDSTDTLGPEGANNLNPTTLSNFNQNNYDNETGGYGNHAGRRQRRPGALGLGVHDGLRRFGGRWVFLRRRKLNRASAFLPLLLLAGGTLRAGTVPGNLGSGLDALVQSNVKFNSAIQEGKTGQITLYNGYATQKAANAATLDGANTSFFGSDDSQDTDSSDNFFGTSDAAPHAAAIAALVLEANGGSGKVTTPAQMKSVLQRSAFPHDLDPYYAKGQARTTDGGKVTIIFKGDDEDSTLTTSFANGTTGIRDPNSILVKYIGPGYLTSLVLNGKAANVTDGTNGLTTPASNQSTYFALSTPGVVFDTGDEPFTLGTRVRRA